MGSRRGSLFGLENKAPSTSWMFNFWRIYRLSTNKNPEVWTQYRFLLSFLGGFSSFKKIVRQMEICNKIKPPEIRKSPEKSQARISVGSEKNWWFMTEYCCCMFEFDGFLLEIVEVVLAQFCELEMRYYRSV